MRYFVLLAFLFLLLGCGTRSPDPDILVPEDWKTSADGADTFQLSSWNMVDSFLLRPEEVYGSRVDVAIDLTLANTGSADFDALVCRSLYEHFADSTGIEKLDCKTAFRDLSNERITAYRAEGEDIGFDYTYNYLYQSTPVLNQGGLLTLDVVHYEYLGGAHGYGYTTYYNFADQPARRLGFDQIFSERADSLTLGVLITSSADVELRNELFEPGETIPMTRNIGLLATGIAFHYPAYELASYARGAIEIVVPYQVLTYRSLLQPEIAEMVGKLEP